MQKAVGFLVVAMLAGCVGSDPTPSEKLTLEVARKNAQRDVVPGVETRKFERKNGWADANAANLYKVLYNYEMALTANLPQAVLELAQTYEQEQKGNQKNAGFMGINDWGNMFQLALQGDSWINAQKDFPQRRDSFLNACEPCMQYWNSEEGGKNATKLRRYAYIQAWAHYESMGFKDAQKKGEGVVWHITPCFMKTENGWTEAM